MNRENIGRTILVAAILGTLIGAMIGLVLYR